MEVLTSTLFGFIGGQLYENIFLENEVLLEMKPISIIIMAIVSIQILGLPDNVVLDTKLRVISNKYGFIRKVIVYP